MMERYEEATEEEMKERMNFEDDAEVRDHIEDLMDMLEVNEYEMEGILEHMMEMSREEVLEEIMNDDEFPGSVMYRCESEDQWSVSKCMNKSDCTGCDESPVLRDYFNTKECRDGSYVECHEYMGEFVAVVRECAEYDDHDHEREERLSEMSPFCMDAHNEDYEYA